MLGPPHSRYWFLGQFLAAAMTFTTTVHTAVHKMHTERPHQKGSVFPSRGHALSPGGGMLRRRHSERWHLQGWLGETAGSQKECSVDSFRHESLFPCENETNSSQKKKKQKHKARHVGPDKNNRKDREEQINVSFLQMSFLFPSGMLQATHSNQAYMTQWQLIHPWCRFTATIQRLFMQLQKTGWLPSWIRRWGACEPSIYIRAPLKDPSYLAHWAPGAQNQVLLWSKRDEGAACVLWGHGNLGHRCVLCCSDAFGYRKCIIPKSIMCSFFQVCVNSLGGLWWDLALHW